MCWERDAEGRSRGEQQRFQAGVSGSKSRLVGGQRSWQFLLHCHAHPGAWERALLASLMPINHLTVSKVEMCIAFPQALNEGRVRGGYNSSRLDINFLQYKPHYAELFRVLSKSVCLDVNFHKPQQARQFQQAGLFQQTH